MNIIEIKDRQGISANDKLTSLYNQFEKLIAELRKKHVPDNVIETINADINEINSSPASGDALRKLLKQKQAKILKFVEKELKIVPKNQYRNMWMVVGMSAFGLPLGVAIGLAVNNLGLLALGLPIGMGVGVAVGSAMDKKAAAEGRQLDIEIKH